MVFGSFSNFNSPQSSDKTEDKRLTAFFDIDHEVSQNNAINPENTLKVKNALIKTKDYTPAHGEISEYPDYAMFEGLKKFQRRKGLVVDGRMRPKGPTAMTINAELAKQVGATKTPDLKSAAKQKQALKALGLYPDDKKIDDHGDDPDFAFAQGSFQRQYNTNQTGIFSLEDVKKLEEIIAPLFQIPQAGTPDIAAPSDPNRTPDPHRPYPHRPYPHRTPDYPHRSPDRVASPGSNPTGFWQTVMSDMIDLNSQQNPKHSMNDLQHRRNATAAQPATNPSATNPPATNPSVPNLPNPAPRNNNPYRLPGTIPAGKSDVDWSKIKDPRQLAAIRRTLEHEGGYSNNGKDRGGETNYGVSQKFLNLLHA
ncbi:MAG: glycosyl hydrolase 108 family protein, partial [Alphaproteobacteria bacterium]